MFKYILKRLLMLIPIIIGISFLIYFVMSLSPGDPARIILGEYATQEDVDALREEMGLNDSLIVQYSRYIFNAVKGDLGTSYQTGQPVMGEILDLSLHAQTCSGSSFDSSCTWYPYRHYLRSQAILMDRQFEHGRLHGAYIHAGFLVWSYADDYFFSQAALVPINRSIIFYALRVAVHHSFLQYICIDDSNDPFYDA